MTDLDDALDRPNPVFHPVNITAEWQELWPNYDPGNSADQFDDLRDLGEQVGPGGYTVNHSLDDGLPDPVTMTSNGDASGQFSSELVGRQGITADTTTFRSPMPGGTGTSTSITITVSNANNVFINDRTVVGVVIPSTTTWTDNQDPEDPWRWQLISSVTDGTVQLLVFTLPVYYNGVGSLVLTLSTSSTWVWTGVAVTAGTHAPASGWVPTRIGTPVKLAETVSQTTHTLPNLTLEKRGWSLAFWATDTSNAWSTTAMTELAESAGAPRLMMARSGLKNQNVIDNGLIASTAVATATVAAIAVPLEIVDRPGMDALQYFSPFNTDSPLYGFSRDTAPVTVGQPVITEIGPVDTTVFTGTMVDIPVSGRTVSMQAVSQTRLDVDRVLELPVIRATRESNCIDWVVGYILSRGRRFIGHKASPYTRWWMPCYGSTHAYVDGNDNTAYNYIPRYYGSAPGVLQTFVPIEDPIRGPYGSALFAQYKDQLVVEISGNPGSGLMPGGATQLGFDPIPLYTNDLMSQANNRGRVSFWIRGDATDVSPACIVGAPAYTNTLFRYRLTASDAGGANQRGEFNLIIREDRRIQLRMGSTLDGITDLVLGLSEIPVDDDWHYVACVWDFDAGTCIVRMDGNTWTQTAWTTTTDSNLPVTDEAIVKAGGQIFQAMRSKLPLSEFQVEAGDVPYNAGVSEFWPGLTGDSGNVVYRPTMQPMGSLALDAPIQGWQTLSELAQATLSHYRTDEQDRFVFLPPEYFGESTQLIPTVVADTDVNAGDLNVTVDPSKARNVVTVEFLETLTDTYSSYPFELTQSTTIPRGVSELTVTSNETVADIFGSSNIGTYFQFIKLTPSQVSGVSSIPNDRHWISVNTKADGTGTVYPSTGLTATLVDWGSNFIVVRFVNSSGQTLYLSNDGAQDLPFLRVRAYVVRQNTGYVTSRDTGSISTRRERSLSMQNPWIHRRDIAEETASTLVNMIARPRPQVTVQVMGDPRRTPGMMVELADSQGTAAEGTWRILSVQHNGSGPQYTQTLELVRVMPVMVWDEAPGWDYTVWGE